MRSLNDILKSEDKFKYQLLARLQQDCDYYLGNGERNPKHLWALNEQDHINYMKEIWKSFPEDKKPEWLTYEQITKYEYEFLKIFIIDK